MKPMDGGLHEAFRDDGGPFFLRRTMGRKRRGDIGGNGLLVRKSFCQCDRVYIVLKAHTGDRMGMRKRRATRLRLACWRNERYE